MESIDDALTLRHHTNQQTISCSEGLDYQPINENEYILPCEGVDVCEEVGGSVRRYGRGRRRLSGCRG